MWSKWGQDLELTGSTLLRTAVVFLAALVLIHLSNRRFMARMSPFDTVVPIVLGATLSRAINGGAGLLPTRAAAAALLALHWTLAALARGTAPQPHPRGGPARSRPPDRPRR